MDVATVKNIDNKGTSTINGGKGETDSTAGEGCKVGDLSGISIGQDGKITGTYTNGQTKLLGQIAVASFANANNAIDSLVGGGGVKHRSYDSMVGPSVTLMEVRAGQVNIRSQYIKPRTGQKPSYTHVDSLYNDFKVDYSTLAKSIMKYNQVQKMTENKIKAKAYLSIPISILLWLILIWIGVNRQDRILINISCTLLVASIIGTAIVLPILLQGLT